MMQAEQPATSPAREHKRRISVGLRTNITIAIVFAAMAALVMIYTYVDHREDNLLLGKTQAEGLNNFYFDALNTLMLADAMEDREILREKMLEQPGVVDIRMMRTEAVKKKFGEGLPAERMQDDLDRRGLAGETVTQVDDVDGQRIITLIMPYKLTENTRGTNCLECHRRIESGTVGGALRISYSLEQADELALSGLLRNLAVMGVLMVVALIALSLMLHRTVVRRLRAMVERFQGIATGDGDLSQRLDERSGDEMGELAHWFNVFTGKLQGMIREVSHYANHLNQAADSMQRIATTTDGNIRQQQTETDQVASAMTQMVQSVRDVAHSATQAADAARQASDEANSGQRMVSETSTAITELANEVETAGGVIERLAKESEEIGAVLDVIRGIAEQTNLLALNAAIEAARAGEQGRGFAVVADEVRTLAKRTQQSTAEIQQMIESLQQGTRTAVEVMLKGKEQAASSVAQAAAADNSLGTISQLVSEISDMCTQIASATEEQDKVSSEIDDNIGNINGLALQTADDASQLAVANSQLSGMADDLLRQLQQFRV